MKELLTRNSHREICHNLLRTSQNSAIFVSSDESLHAATQTGLGDGAASEDLRREISLLPRESGDLVPVGRYKKNE